MIKQLQPVITELSAEFGTKQTISIATSKGAVVARVGSQNDAAISCLGSTRFSDQAHRVVKLPHDAADGPGVGREDLQ